VTRGGEARAVDRRNRRGRATAVVLALLTSAGAGCSAFPGAADAGRRLLADGFVSLTAPLQVPAMAARDAWAACAGEEGSSKALLPAWFVAFAFEHAGLCALHLVDLTAAPIHLVAGNRPPRIYRPWSLPMERDRDGVLGHEAGELALYGVAGVGGAAIAWWFGTSYVPHVFRWFVQ